MKKIIALGGGEIGRPGYPIETTQIDKEIIKLTGKKNPKLLFIPTASSDSESYYEVVKKHFGKRLGCKTNVLYLIKEKLSQKEIKEKILNSDIIYVGGGDTLKMMRVWKKNGVDKILKQAYEKGVVLSGLSAGSICWFKYGISDSKRFTNPNAGLIKVSGLENKAKIVEFSKSQDLERHHSLALYMDMADLPAVQAVLGLQATISDSAEVRQLMVQYAEKD